MVLDRRMAHLGVVRGRDAGKRGLEKIDNPPNLGRLRGRINKLIGRRSMKILLDTNTFIHAHNSASQSYRKAADILRKAIRGEVKACIAPQILYEFFSIVSNTRRVEHLLRGYEASEICLDLWRCREIEKGESAAKYIYEGFNLIKRLNLSGGKVFDRLLAVTAKEDGVEMIYNRECRRLRSLRLS